MRYAAVPQCIGDALDLVESVAEMSTVYKVHEILCRLALSLKKCLKTATLYLTLRKQRIDFGSEEPLGVQLMGACFNLVLTFKRNFF